MPFLVFFELRSYEYKVLGTIANTLLVFFLDHHLPPSLLPPKIITET